MLQLSYLVSVLHSSLDLLVQQPLCFFDSVSLPDSLQVIDASLIVHLCTCNDVALERIEVLQTCDPFLAIHLETACFTGSEKIPKCSESSTSTFVSVVLLLSVLKLLNFIPQLMIWRSPGDVEYISPKTVI